jgi:hypothetical protein
MAEPFRLVKYDNLPRCLLLQPPRIPCWNSLKSASLACNVSRFPFLLIIPPFSRISFQKKLPQPRLCFFRWIPDVLFKVNQSVDGTAWSPGGFFFLIWIARHVKTDIYVYIYICLWHFTTIRSI